MKNATAKSTVGSDTEHTVEDSDSDIEYQEISDMDRKCVSKTDSDLDGSNRHASETESERLSKNRPTKRLQPRQWKAEPEIAPGMFEYL